MSLKLDCPLMITTHSKKTTFWRLGLSPSKERGTRATLFRPLHNAYQWRIHSHIFSYWKTHLVFFMCSKMVWHESYMKISIHYFLHEPLPIAQPNVRIRHYKHRIPKRVVCIFCYCNPPWWKDDNIWPWYADSENDKIHNGYESDNFFPVLV